jgi:flagellar biosynthesis/type III secretory pathway chaperone
MGDPKSLAARLRQERDLLQRLLTSVEEQRACLIAGKAESLGEIVSRQTALLQRLFKTADKTAALLNESENGLKDSSPEAEECRGLRDEVRQLAENLRREGRINWVLAREAMRYADFSINLLAGREKEPSYSPNGKQQSRLSAILMNRTA